MWGQVNRPEVNEYPGIEVSIFIKLNAKQNEFATKISAEKTILRKKNLNKENKEGARNKTGQIKRCGTIP